LTEESLLLAAEDLSKRDPDLARVYERLGPPPLWDREPGFPTLVYIILEQQVSLASAKAAFDKLTKAVSPLDPTAFLTLDDPTLKAIGFSGQKGRYCRELAQAVLGGSLDVERLPSLSDEQVRTELVRIIGIGRWTADIYLLMALGRPDVWPRGDLALLASRGGPGVRSRLASCGTTTSIRWERRDRLDFTRRKQRDE
jgi:DNA-3-methyladenine glycosylase II